LATASPREEESTVIDTEAVLREDEAAESGPEKFASHELASIRILLYILEIGTARALGH
jgi:hypothetical protein